MPAKSVKEVSPELLLGKVKSILISQPEPASGKSPFYDLAKKHNLKVDFRKFISIEPATVREFRKSRVELSDYTAIIFTSKLAITHFFKMCEELRHRMSAETKYLCSSEAIALYLQKFIEYRKRKVFFPKEGKGDFYAVMDRFKKTDKLFFPTANFSTNDIPVYLKDNEFEFATAVIYNVISSDLSDLKNIYYDIIVFFTPLGIKSLYDNFPDFIQNKTRLAGWGEQTSKAIDEAGLRLDIKAPVPKAPSMTMAIEQYVNMANKK